jgi:hypothetical protein
MLGPMFADRFPGSGSGRLVLSSICVPRKAPDNALYVIANALALPKELGGMASKITINFP